jgi:hypothetical protein
MTDIMIKILGLSAVAGFGIIGTLRWLKPLLPSGKFAGVVCPLVSLALCVLSAVGIYKSEMADKSAYVIIPLSMLCLTFSQLGYEGLVKPLLKKVLGVEVAEVKDGDIDKSA